MTEQQLIERYTELFCDVAANGAASRWTELVGKYNAHLRRTRRMLCLAELDQYRGRTR